MNCFIALVRPLPLFLACNALAHKGRAVKQKILNILILAAFLALLFYFADPIFRYSPKYYLIYLLAVLAILFQPAFSITDTSSPTDKGTVLGIVYSIQMTQTMGFFEAIFYWGPDSLDWTTPTWIGLALAVGGLALRSWAYNSLGKAFTWHIDPSQADAVYRDGPYKIVRHPSYTGAYFLYFGTLLIMGAWVAAALSVVAMYWALARRIHFEEIALSEKFGDSYRSFQKEVGAVLPGLGKK